MTRPGPGLARLLHAGPAGPASTAATGGPPVGSGWQDQCQSDWRPGWEPV